MINLLRSVAHRLLGRHTGAVQISDEPNVMWCPACKLAWRHLLGWSNTETTTGKAKTPGQVMDEPGRTKTPT
ncbi:hypothetical protein LCGC14_0889840 [marine sediment metagenome]|uniref:Uncharacterized protein n=1 Tax=marine sediment metagenome TaxID=412755 RepID=A0A0F9RIW1_9ZZZZ